MRKLILLLALFYTLPVFAFTNLISIYNEGFDTGRTEADTVLVFRSGSGSGSGKEITGGQLRLVNNSGFTVSVLDTVGRISFAVGDSLIFVWDTINTTVSAGANKGFHPAYGIAMETTSPDS